VSDFLRRLAFCAAVLAMPLAHAEGLFLAPGKTLTILDAADPTVRVVLKAPAGAPLDLGSILVAAPQDSVYAIVTRIQVSAAKGLSREPDGSVALSDGARAEPLPGNTLQGGVLVFSGGKFVYHAEQTAASAAPPPAASAPASGAAPVGGRLLISKPGVARAQAERDIAQCRRYAEQAAASFLRATDRVAMYNASMHSCLKSFGYEIHAPAA
jgi:hypothetical protein